MNLVRINLFIALTVLVALNGCNSKQPRFRGSSDSGSKKDLVAISEIQPAYVDKDYQFRIDPPSTKWRLFGDPESRKVLPDAVAAGIRVDGTYGGGVVEPIEDTDLDSLAKFIQENLKAALPDVESDPAQEIVFEGIPAIKFTSTGSTNDTRFYYTHLLFVRQDFGFQLITRRPNRSSQSAVLVRTTGLASSSRRGLSARTQPIA